MQDQVNLITGNRRSDDPVNSRLNYGYAVVRSAIARAIVSVGCHPAFGVHHNSQLNAFNLVDDLIEPFRAIVDIVVHENIGSNEKLSKMERQSLAHVLHNACIVDGTRVNILSAVELMRITPTRRASEKHYRRLKEYAPKTGIVRVFKLTERQYDSIYMLTGEIDYQENTVGRNCHIMLQWRH